MNLYNMLAECEKKKPLLIHSIGEKRSFIYLDSFPLYASQTGYRFSTNKKCIAIYPNTRNTPQKTPKPNTSSHMASTLNPKLDKIAEPGTSMSRPYCLSTRER